MSAPTAVVTDANSSAPASSTVSASEAGSGEWGSTVVVAVTCATVGPESGPGDTTICTGGAFGGSGGKVQRATGAPSWPQVQVAFGEPESSVGNDVSSPLIVMSGSGSVAGPSFESVAMYCGDAPSAEVAGPDRVTCRDTTEAAVVTFADTSAALSA